MTTPRSRELDVVVFGATGFVGRLVAEHLAHHAPDGIRIGLAGRSTARLEAVRVGLGPRAREWPLLTADSDDDASLEALARATTVVATTVGPYARHGLRLVRACAAEGTHYADLTGEVLFVRRAIDQSDAAARATGARIVNSCGFDSVPSDLAVLLADEQAKTDKSGDLTDVTFTLVAARGGVSGGTIDSLRNQVDEVTADASLRGLLDDPYSLSPDRPREPELGPEPDLVPVSREPASGRWITPFVMAPHNTRIVRRSNALTGWQYGRSLRYREVLSCGTSPAAPVIAAAVGLALRGVTAGLSVRPVRAVLDKVLPDPGSGPAERVRQRGHFRAEVRASTTSGAQYLVRVGAQGDPGYAATAVMLGQSALCLALDTDHLPDRAGVLTPATAMGTTLADRLVEHGFTLSVSRI